LNVFPISAPPLRDRKEDVPLLLDYFIKKYCFENNRRLVDLADDAKNILKSFSLKIEFLYTFIVLEIAWVFMS